MNVKKIEVKEIAKLHFSPKDVLENEAQKTERNNKLISGSILGNIEKQKCKIVFHAKEGDSYVEATIWALTDKYICLKGGLYLLITSVIDVIL